MSTSKDGSSERSTTRELPPGPQLASELASLGMRRRPGMGEVGPARRSPRDKAFIDDLTEFKRLGPLFPTESQADGDDIESYAAAAIAMDAYLTVVERLHGGTMPGDSPHRARPGACGARDRSTHARRRALLRLRLPPGKDMGPGDAHRNPPALSPLPGLRQKIRRGFFPGQDILLRSLLQASGLRHLRSAETRYGRQRRAREPRAAGRGCLPHPARRRRRRAERLVWNQGLARVPRHVGWASPDREMCGGASSLAHATPSSNEAGTGSIA